MANPPALLGVQPPRPQAQPAGPASHLHRAEPVVLPGMQPPSLPPCLLGPNTSALGRQAARKHVHVPKAFPPPSGLSTSFLKGVFLKQNGRGTEQKMNLPREVCSGSVSGGKAPHTAALAARCQALAEDNHHPLLLLLTLAQPGAPAASSCLVRSLGAGAALTAGCLLMLSQQPFGWLGAALLAVLSLTCLAALSV